MAACNGCDEIWRFWSVDLRTGVMRKPLRPMGASWSSRLNAPGQGTLTMATKGLAIRDVWPHLIGIGIETMTNEGWKPYWYGYVEKATPADNGATSLGLVEVDTYLNRRNLMETLKFAGVNQTEIVAALVEWVRTHGGIPLRGVSEASSYPRDRTYDWYNLPNIGELVTNLTEIINGPDYELVHRIIEGGLDTPRRWESDLISRDVVGVDRNLVLQSDREAAGYSLDIDAMDHATTVIGVGVGEEEDMLVAVAQDSRNIYPQFDAVPAWKDVSVFETLSEHADGFLGLNRDPVAIPALTLAGMNVDPFHLAPGDPVHVRTSFGAVSYHGGARLTEVAWTLDEGAPRRSLTMDPIGDPIESVLNQESEQLCGGCDGTAVDVGWGLGPWGLGNWGGVG